MSVPPGLVTAAAKTAALRARAAGPADRTATLADHLQVLTYLQDMFPPLITAVRKCDPSGSSAPALGTAHSAVSFAVDSLTARTRKLRSRSSPEAARSEPGAALTRAARTAAAATSEIDFAPGATIDVVASAIEIQSLLSMLGTVLASEAAHISYACDRYRRPRGDADGPGPVGGNKTSDFLNAGAEAITRAVRALGSLIGVPPGYYRDGDGTLRRQHDLYGGPHDNPPGVNIVTGQVGAVYQAGDVYGDVNLG